jgi:hypothetical protein
VLWLLHKVMPRLLRLVKFSLLESLLWFRFSLSSCFVSIFVLVLLLKYITIKMSKMARLVIERMSRAVSIGYHFLFHLLYHIRVGGRL